MISQPFPALLTPRLKLRCVTAEDAAATSLLMTPAVSNWLASWPVPFTPKMAGVRIEAMRNRAFGGHALPFAVTLRTTGALLGWTIIERNEHDRDSASMGFWLGEQHQSRGYMREAAPVVMAAGFEFLTVTVIEAGAQPANAGSIAVMKACGMKLAGERLVHASARNREELCCFYEIRCP